MELEKQYRIHFEQFFENVREAFRKSVAYHPDDELSSGELAHKKAIWSLPCPVKVVRLKIDIDKYKQASAKTYHLIAFELSDPGKSDVTYYGEIDIDDLGKHSGLLHAFGLALSNVEELKTFRIESYADSEKWRYLTVIPYDILAKPLEHAKEFRWSFSMMFGGKILREFEESIDFNSKYDLKSEPILFAAELLQKDKTFSGFVKVDRHGKGREITIEDMQRDICDVLLIPPVPEDVKKVFDGAKKLYIFGYFDYYFFTISQHYAFLALESALKHIYHELSGKSSRRISLDSIIKYLVEKKAIPKGEASLYDAGRSLRNELSHLVKQKTMPPGPGILENVAYQINYLFDNQ
jgi:hypothetical protein